MRYFANPCGDAVIALMRSGELGYIDTPSQKKSRVSNAASWCADSGIFGTAYVGDDKWFEWLQKHAGEASTCAFATAPDVVGDADATIERSRPWFKRIRGLGYPVAFVAQDGLTVSNGVLLTEGFKSSIAWQEFDCLFIGGTTKWKLGPQARAIAVEAKARGKWLHMGRVNSEKRFRYARAIGCDSVDGTYLTFGPDTNLPKLLGWLRGNDQDYLFGGVA